MGISSHLQSLRNKHSELDKQISKAQRTPGACSIEITALKKQRLRLKEEMIGKRHNVGLSKRSQ